MPPKRHRALSVFDVLNRQRAARARAQRRLRALHAPPGPPAPPAPPVPHVPVPHAPPAPPPPPAFPAYPVPPAAPVPAGWPAFAHAHGGEPAFTDVAMIPRPGMYSADFTQRFWNELDNLGIMVEDAVVPNQWYIDLPRFRIVWGNVRTDILAGLRPQYATTVQNLMRRLIGHTMTGHTTGPSLASSGAYPGSWNRLIVPFDTQYDMYPTLFLFLLQFMAGLTPNRMYSFWTTFKFVAGGGQDLQKVKQASGSVTIPPNGAPNFGLLLFDHFCVVYNQLMHRFAALQQVSNNEIGPWNVDESGDVWNVLLSFTHGSLNNHIAITLYTTQFHPYVVGDAWDDRFQEVLKNQFPNGGYVTVKNREDDLCFAYMVALGVSRIEDRDLRRRNRNALLEVDELATLIRLKSSSENGKKLMMKIMEKDLGDSEFQKEVGHSLNLQRMFEVMKDGEERLVPKDIALDVSIIDVPDGKGLARTNHIYPVYNSKRKGERLSLLIVRIDEDHSHFCLMTDPKLLYKSSGGKIFFTCGKCHQSFFTQKMLTDHDHRKIGEKGECPETEWHWNRAGMYDISECVGVCQKCHLQFMSQQDFEYHQKHCFMAGRSGNRNVMLAEERGYELKGEEIKESSNPVDRVCFADFESSIDPETGDHSFMSYGLYDCRNDEFRIGYSMEEFIQVLTGYASEGKHLKCYFHNAMGYDANFILRYVLNAEDCKNWAIRVVMKSSTRLQKLSFMFDTRREVVEEKNGERKVSVKRTKRILEIGDTLAFFTLSLESLVTSVKGADAAKNCQMFPRFFSQFRKKYTGVGDADIDMILKKNLFPYKFFTASSQLDVDLEKFKMIFEPKEENLQFFSENVSVEDLERNYPDFSYICEAFDIHSARDYHDLYLMCDVMEISDIFMKGREALVKTHHIDLNDYMGMPGAAWHAFLRQDPSLILPLPTSTRQLEFFQDMLRGGVTSAPLRYAKRDDSHSIMYLDVNGLYPFVMQEDLPLGRFIERYFELNDGMVGDQELDSDLPRLSRIGNVIVFLRTYFEWLQRKKRGCCMAVDLHVPDDVKDRTDMYPFAPEHREIRDEYYDENGVAYSFMSKWQEQNDGKKITPFRGLVGTLYDKKEYGVNWKVLKWYMEHGMQVTRLYWGVEYDEAPYMRDYVRKNIELRNNCTDEMHKIEYKFLGNAVFGKTCENKMNRGKFLIVRNNDTLRGVIERDRVLSISPIDENNCVIKLDGDDVVMDKPSYIGACITEYAKLHMYRIFYDELPKMFPMGVELVYTDTDSFIVRVAHRPGMTSEEIFDQMKMINPNFIGKLGGQLKSETGVDLIDEVIALRSKVYTYRTISGKIGKRAKGTTRAAQERDLDWEAYKQALFEYKSVPVINQQFIRKSFQVRSAGVEKIALSGNDGKRKIEPDGIHTHAWGFDEREQPRIEIDDDGEETEEEEQVESRMCEMM